MTTETAENVNQINKSADNATGGAVSGGQPEAPRPNPFSRAGAARAPDTVLPPVDEPPLTEKPVNAEPPRRKRGRPPGSKSSKNKNRDAPPPASGGNAARSPFAPKVDEANGQQQAAPNNNAPTADEALNPQMAADFAAGAACTVFDTYVKFRHAYAQQIPELKDAIEIDAKKERNLAKAFKAYFETQKINLTPEQNLAFTLTATFLPAVIALEACRWELVKRGANV
jgi:hypothetical protein